MGCVLWKILEGCSGLFKWWECWRLRMCCFVVYIWVFVVFLLGWVFWSGCLRCCGLWRNFWCWFWLIVWGVVWCCVGWVRCLDFECWWVCVFWLVWMYWCVVWCRIFFFVLCSMSIVFCCSIWWCYRGLLELLLCWGWFGG